MRDDGGQGGGDRPRAAGDAAIGPRGTRRRLRRGYVWAAAVLVVLAAGVVTAIVARSGSGLGTGTWWTPGHPQLQVSVAAGCPESVGSYADVVNTFAGPPPWSRPARAPGSSASTVRTSAVACPAAPTSCSRPASTARRRSSSPP
jgi:hypothetical protein